MGADAGMEDGADGGSLRAVRSRRDLSHLCRGRTAHGDHLWDFLWPISRAGFAPTGHRVGFNSFALVLRSVDWLSGVGDPRDGDVVGSDCELGFETSERSDQLAVRGGADYFDFGTAAVFSGRLPVIIFCGALPDPHGSG